MLGAALASLAIVYYVFLRVPLEYQFFSATVILVVSIGLARYRPDLKLYLVLISSTVSLRYIVWRATHTLTFYSVTDTILGLTLFAAECYGILILLLGYFQTVQEYRRVPVPLPSDPDKLPWVDVFIPTYNEPVSVLQRTAIGAMAMDYPKKRVYILDDGRRENVRALAEELGCGYLTRKDNKHAKAGNINEALKRTSGEYVAIFDADHVPVRSFLQMTVGFLLQDPKIALVQTPHHFFNPDPFQRNLLVQGIVPAEQELFYHIILVGNDFWNSAFFCGSCALLRRSALMEVGGVAHETITEDAHTALKLHAKGWHSAYLAIPQAAGLATERYAFHVRQRMRWAQGMVQIL
ncbi:glycosyltransferase, partial [Candidatus Parcubacteria bacterium]